MKISCRKTDHFSPQKWPFFEPKNGPKITDFLSKNDEKSDAEISQPKAANSHRAPERLKPPFAILLSMHLISSAIPRAREGGPCVA